MIPSGPMGLLLLFMTSFTTSFNQNNSVADDTFPETTNFNQMELYVNAKEGVSLAYDGVDGQKFAYFMEYFTNTYWQRGTSFKSNAVKSYTRILVGPTKGNNIYPLQYFYYFGGDTLLSRKFDMVVHQNNDGTVSLSCDNTGKYATWGNSQYDDGSWWSTSNSVPMCTESGICPHCRYKLVIGSITDISIRLVDLEWGDPDEAIPSSPSQVAEDFTENYTNTEVKKTLTVTYKSETSDKTIWERAWGFEYSVSAEAHIDIPLVGGGSVTTTATASYNGMEGTENTVTNSTVFSYAVEVICPAQTKCILKYVASKLDNYNMPFTATVERSQDEGPPIVWEEEGVWQGVQAFNFQTIYCSESLETGDSNCPTFAWIK